MHAVGFYGLGQGLVAKSGIRGWVRAGGQRMVAQVEQEGRECWHRWSRRAEDGDAAGAGRKRMVEQEGRGWWHRWNRRAEDGGTGGAGGQRMVAQVEQEGRGWWRRWRGGQMVVQV